MTNLFSCEPFSILRGNSLNILSTLQTEVDCVITSPPYFKKRDYGTHASELGRESSIAEYINNLLNIFRAIPLAPWASVWVNIGDKRKNGALLNIPERFCVAMNDIGFYRIDHVIWAKESVRIDGTSVGHCMIEPANRRLNSNGHEPLYRFVRNPKLAWTDTSAVRIPGDNVDDVRYLPAELMQCHTSTEGRNLTNVWNVPPSKTDKSHYAVYPPALIERPVAMTCPLVITKDGPQTRVTRMDPYEEACPAKRGVGKYTKPESEIRSRSGRHDVGREYIPKKPVTVGWSPDLPLIRRGIVLDPFCGSGSTGEVAIKLGRNFIGVELYEEYARIAEDRCHDAYRLRNAYELSVEHNKFAGANYERSFSGITKGCKKSAAFDEMIDGGNTESFGERPVSVSIND